MMSPREPFVCRPQGADRVVLKVPISVVPRGPRRLRGRFAAARVATVCAMQTGTPGVDRRIEVIIADDHAVVRDGIRTVLEREADEFHIVAEAADVPATIREVRAHKPDLLTLDLSMPGGSGLAALPQCFVAHATLAVAILTMREDPEYARQAL